jgi:hypothetical protein
MRFLFVVVLIFGLLYVGRSQQFRCEASREVYENSTFELALIVENGKATNLKPPKINGARIVGGPITSTEVTIFNGKESSVFKHIYTYSAESKSEISVASTSALINGKSYSTTPFKIQVRSTQSINKELIGDFMVRTEISSNEAYLGQQIQVSYVLYYTNFLEVEDVLSESNYNGAIFSRVKNPLRQEKTINSNGKTYQSKTLYQIMLIPHKLGKFEIDPFVISAMVPTKNSHRSIFGYTDLKQIKLTSKPVALHIKSLPLATDKFSGAVGSYQFQTIADKSQMSLDEALPVFAIIKGNGDKRLVKNPIIQTNIKTEIYDPKIVEEDEGIENGELVHYKKLEYLIVPKDTGKLEAQILFNYFDPLSGEYKNADNSPITVYVKKGNDKPTTKDQLENNAAKSSFSSVWIVLTSMLVLSLFLYFAFKKYKRKKEASLDPIERNKILASKKIVKHLQLAKSKMDKGDEKEFYAVLSSSLNEYLVLKFNIPTEYHHKDYIFNSIKESFGSDLAERYISLLHVCESSIYGLGSQSSSYQTFQEAKSILETIEGKS